MRIVHGADLAKRVRAASDAATQRLWIASPYVGAWPGNVRRILGIQWRAADVRLLTDVAARGVRKNTALQFARRGAVRTLLGLHAKIYVADNFVMVSSANLTGTAFSKRHEIGVIMTGSAAKQTIEVFERWWHLDSTEGVDPDSMPEPKKSETDPGEASTEPLVALHALPADAPDPDLHQDVFGDYDRFLTRYDTLMSEYFAIQRLWKNASRRFEVDGFLNFLYRNASGTPSRPYRKRKARALTAGRRHAEIARHAALFAGAWRNGAIGDDDPRWRNIRARKARALLKRNERAGISRDEFERLLLLTNAMNAYRLNAAKAVNPANHTMREVRDMLRHLVDERFLIQRRMSDCAGQITGVGKSAIQELVGFCWPEKYPLRNLTSNAGLRFFGFNVRVD